MIEQLREKLQNSTSIIGKRDYFNSAVLVPMILFEDGYHLLFQKRAANIRQGGEISFPGGEYDPRQDKDFVETALRETVEELGIEKEKIELIGRMNLYIAPMGVTVDPVLGILKIKNISELNIDKNEVESVFTVPLKFFLENQPEIYSSRIVIEPYYIDEKGEKIDLLPVKELKLPERYLERRIGKSAKVYVHRVENEVIWGITAGITRELVRLIKNEPEMPNCCV